MSVGLASKSIYNHWGSRHKDLSDWTRAKIILVQRSHQVAWSRMQFKQKGSLLKRPSTSHNDLNYINLPFFGLKIPTSEAAGPTWIGVLMFSHEFMWPRCKLNVGKSLNQTAPMLKGKLTLFLSVFLFMHYWVQTNRIAHTPNSTADSSEIFA